MKKYVVTLTEDERAALDRRVSSGRSPARDLTHARILLKSDDKPNGPGWTDVAISTALEVSTSAVERLAGASPPGAGGGDPPSSASPRVPTEARRGA